MGKPLWYILQSLTGRPLVVDTRYHARPDPLCCAVIKNTGKGGGTGTGEEGVRWVDPQLMPVPPPRDMQTADSEL